MIFADLNFKSHIHLKNFNFNYVSFRNCEFYIGFDISDTKIYGNILFDKVLFKNLNYIISFENSILNEGITIKNSEINSAIFINKTKIDNNFIIVDSIIINDIIVDESEIYGCIEFERSKFLKICTFNNAKLFNKTKFDNANFVNFVPDFRGASLHEATEFYGTKWPSPPEDIQSAQSQVSAYEHLRKEMDRLKRNNDEFMFLRKELRARRVLTQNLLVKFLDILYEFLSDYGSSIAKPMAWMGAILVLGTIIFCKAGLNFGTSLLFSLSNMFPFLPIGKDFIDKKELSHLSSPAEAFSIAQMVAGPILLFLLILAVRNMFKIR